MKIKLMKVSMFLFTVLFGLFLTVTPAAATGRWSETTSFTKDGVKMSKTVYTEYDSKNKVNFQETKVTSTAFKASYPKIPLNGVVKGNEPTVITNVVIPVVVTNPAKPSETITINVPSVVKEHTKKTGVWPFQKTVKSGTYYVLGSVVLTNFQAFGKTYAKVLVTLKMNSGGHNAPSTEKATYMERINQLANNQHPAAANYFEIKNDSFHDNREKNMEAYRGYNLWIRTMNVKS